METPCQGLSYAAHDHRSGRLASLLEIPASVPCQSI